ncbi:MAG: Phosphate acyltransferase [Opitutia bacterium UBA7350]|nr:MAG: Phosphate acyltransferase [Opitutae bacterium UBA7350]
MTGSAAPCTIAVDVMGSDLGPSEFIRGLLYARKELKLDSNIVLVGKEPLIKRFLKVKHAINELGNVRIHHASEVVDMHDKPVQAMRKKKDASMFQAIHLAKEGEVDAVVSCGNTGALMAAGTIRLRPLEGIDRPALATIIPTKQNACVLIDVGANPECSPQNLLHNAILGANYARSALDLEKPRVALLTIGTEDGKGTSLINETHENLKAIDGIINYQGLIEGFQIFEGEVDVIVCDGFIGNILLKSSEALFSFVGNTIKDELRRNAKRMLGAALAKSAFSDMRNRLSPDHHAGAPLLGLKGNLLKSHGSSNYVAIANAIRIASEIVRHDLLDTIQSDILKANSLLLELSESTPAE